MNIKIKNININIICVFLILLFLSINFSVYTLIILSCILIHEAGHIIFIKSRGVTILSIDVTPVGVNIITSGLASYKTDIMIALFGPAFNIFAALLILPFLRLASGGSTTLLLGFLTNLIFAAINLFPVAGLDGGRAMASILKMYLSEERARKIFTTLSAIFLVVLSVCALIILTLTRYNFSLVLLCGYLFYTIYFRPMSFR